VWFWFLCYRASIENVNVVTAEYVRSLKDLSKRDFESKIWEDFGKFYYGDRRLVKHYLMITDSFIVIVVVVIIM